MELRTFLVRLRRWWWYLVLGTLLAMLASSLITRRLTPMYEAHATLLVNTASTPNGPTASDMTLSQQLVKTFIQLADQPVILEQVADQLGDSVTPQQLARMVTVQPVRDTQLFTIGARGPDPVLVRDVSNSAAAVFIDQQTQWLPQNQTNTSISVVQPAIMPTQPSGEVSPVVTLTLAGLVGFLLTLGVTLVGNALDDSLKTPEELEQATGIPSLGSVMRLSQRTSDRPRGLLDRGAVQAPEAEAYRLIRTRLDFIALQHPFRTLLVTSPRPGEGRSTTVANLALALAQAGRRVIAVDADLRQPSLHRLFGLSDQPGLANLLGQPEITSDPQSWAGCLQAGPVPGLRILTSGPLPLYATELLQSPRFTEVLSWLGREADIVLLDSPPLLGVADALVLAQAADATLVVALAGRTPAAALRRAVVTLGQSRSVVVGGVLNGYGSRARRPSWGAAAALGSGSRADPLPTEALARVGPPDGEKLTYSGSEPRPQPNGHSKPVGVAAARDDPQSSPKQ